ncbi:hypothetical protein FGB62_19g123 [Gracilaria domingensis]|nr:hypothetical protein FGB62_19g123 [Gracilaria domingensis]
MSVMASRSPPAHTRAILGSVWPLARNTRMRNYAQFYYPIGLVPDAAKSEKYSLRKQLRGNETGIYDVCNPSHCVITAHLCRGSVLMPRLSTLRKANETEAKNGLTRSKEVYL